MCDSWGQCEVCELCISVKCKSSDSEDSVKHEGNMSVSPDPPARTRPPTHFLPSSPPLLLLSPGSAPPVHYINTHYQAWPPAMMTMVLTPSRTLEYVCPCCESGNKGKSERESHCDVTICVCRQPVTMQHNTTGVIPWHWITHPATPTDTPQHNL